MFNKAMDTYSDLVGAQREPDMEYVCNLYAAYTAADKGADVLSLYPMPDDGRYDNQYETYYNRACAYLSAGKVSLADQDLAQSEVIGRKVLSEEGYVSEEIEKELAAVRLQAAYVKILNGHLESPLEVCKDILRVHGQSKGKQEGTGGDLELVAVAANNLAVLRGTQDVPEALRRLRTTITNEMESKLSSSQLKEVRLNRCVLMLHLRKPEDALRVTDELENT